MIRALALAAALTGCSHMDSPAPAPHSDNTVLHSPTIDGTPERPLTLDEAAADILGSGKYETATFALG